MSYILFVAIGVLPSARDDGYISDIPFVWITCDTCDFDFGSEWKWTDYGDMLAEFEYYLKGLNNE